MYLILVRSFDRSIDRSICLSICLSVSPSHVSRKHSHLPISCANTPTSSRLHPHLSRIHAHLFSLHPHLQRKHPHLFRKHPHLKRRHALPCVYQAQRARWRLTSGADPDAWAARRSVRRGAGAAPGGRMGTEPRPEGDDAQCGRHVCLRHSASAHAAPRAGPPSIKVGVSQEVKRTVSDVVGCAPLPCCVLRGAWSVE